MVARNFLHIFEGIFCILIGVIGHNGHAVDSVLAQFIPEAEFAFINQFEDFGNPQRLGATVKRLERREVGEAAILPKEYCC